jgi:hypothetical protein
MRAAQHIVYQSKNTVSESFDALLDAAVSEANALIEATRGEKSTIIAMRDSYGARMSQSFAFLRDIPSMDASLTDIRRDLETFTADNKWTKIFEICFLFKNLDILRMQEAIAEAISFTAKKFGSRGSGFVLNGTNFMDREPVPEETSGRSTVVTVCKKDGIKVDSTPIRPLPERDLWFERVWGKYRDLTEK